MYERYAFHELNSDLNEEEWPLLTLTDATVHLATPGEELVDILDVVELGPLRVKGRVKKLDKQWEDIGITVLLVLSRDVKEMQADGRTIVRSPNFRQYDIVIPKVYTYSIETHKPGKKPTIWILGQAGWYAIEPSAEYAPIFHTVLEKAMLWRFVEEWDQDDGVEDLFEEYGRRRRCDGEAAFVRHHRFLITKMLENEDAREQWMKTPLWEFCAKWKDEVEEIYEVLARNKQRLLDMENPKTPGRRAKSLSRSARGSSARRKPTLKPPSENKQLSTPISQSPRPDFTVFPSTGAIVQESSCRWPPSGETLTCPSTPTVMGDNTAMDSTTDELKLQPQSPLEERPVTPRSPSPPYLCMPSSPLEPPSPPPEFPSRITSSPSDSELDELENPVPNLKRPLRCLPDRSSPNKRLRTGPMVKEEVDYSWPPLRPGLGRPPIRVLQLPDMMTIRNGVWRCSIKGCTFMIFDAGHSGFNVKVENHIREHSARMRKEMEGLGIDRTPRPNGNVDKFLERLEEMARQWTDSCESEITVEEMLQDLP